MAENKGKPPELGTVWAAQATLYDESMRPVAACTDTPNAIAKAFMETPKAQMVKGLFGLQNRSDYRSRMQPWNECPSHLVKVGSQGPKGAKRRAGSPRLSR